MKIIRIFILCISILCLILGITTILSPDINFTLSLLGIANIQAAYFVRLYAGFITAVGYLSMRFLYSSSKVQIGTVVMYIIFFIAISKIFSFIYEGFTLLKITSFLIGIAFASGLYIVQKARKNQLNYDL